MDGYSSFKQVRHVRETQEGLWWKANSDLLSNTDMRTGTRRGRGSGSGREKGGGKVLKCRFRKWRFGSNDADKLGKAGNTGSLSDIDDYTPLIRMIHYPAAWHLVLLTWITTPVVVVARWLGLSVGGPVR